MAIPFDVQIVGDNLNTMGFEAYQTMEGLGLISQGFLWPLEGIWTVCTDCDDSVVTVWTDCTNC